MEQRAQPKRWSGWLVGCGLGCGLIVLGGLILGGIGAFYVSRMVHKFDDSVADAKQLDERFGEPGAFVPAADGAIPPERMEAFLAVREALAGPRAALAQTFGGMSRVDGPDFEKKPAWEKLRVGYGVGRSAMRLGPAIGEFFGVRDRAMLDAGIGTGEYTYIYALAYYSWLGHGLSDQPRLRADRSGDETNESASRVRADLIRMLENELAAVPPSAHDWHRSLEAELEAMKRTEGRTPWQGAVPPAIAASLAPYRERLERTYDAAVNPFELARVNKEGRWSYRSD